MCALSLECRAEEMLFEMVFFVAILAALERRAGRAGYSSPGVAVNWNYSSLQNQLKQYTLFSILFLHFFSRKITAHLKECLHCPECACVCV